MQILLAFEYVKTNVDKKTSLKKLNPWSMCWYHHNRKNLVTAF